MVYTAPPPIGLEIMLLWSGSLTTPPALSAAPIGFAPVWDDRDRVGETIGRYNIISCSPIDALARFFSGDRGTCQFMPSLFPRRSTYAAALRGVPGEKPFLSYPYLIRSGRLSGGLADDQFLS
jgi:hypothetical protein